LSVSSVCSSALSLHFHIHFDKKHLLLFCTSLVWNRILTSTSSVFCSASLPFFLFPAQCNISAVFCLSWRSLPPSMPALSIKGSPADKMPVLLPWLRQWLPQPEQLRVRAPATKLVQWTCQLLVLLVQLVQWTCQLLALLALLVLLVLLAMLVLLVLLVLLAMLVLLELLELAAQPAQGPVLKPSTSWAIRTRTPSSCYLSKQTVHWEKAPRLPLEAKAAAWSTQWRMSQLKLMFWPAKVPSEC
jgi:hypothetical protein